MCVSAQRLMPSISSCSEEPSGVRAYSTVTGTVGVTERVTRPSRSSERGVDIRAVSVTPDGARLAVLLERAGRGELSARVRAGLPLSEVAEAHRAIAKGGVRGRYVLIP